MIASMSCAPTKVSSLSAAPKISTKAQSKLKALSPAILGHPLQYSWKVCSLQSFWMRNTPENLHSAAHKLSTAARIRATSARLVPPATSTVDAPSTAFPSFFPPEVEELEEEAARDLAYRVQRLPVQTALADHPIMTGCVVPVTTGQAELPILLLHGFDSSCLEWRRLLPLLEAQGMEAWALDILGWGFTDARLESGLCSVEAKREHIYEFWRQHVGRQAVVVGPSLGGAAAIDFALAHPDAVAKLVLVDAQGFAEGVGPMASLPKFLAYAGVRVLQSIPLRSYAQQLAYRDPRLATTDAMRVGRLHTLLPGWGDALVAFMRSGGYSVAARVHQLKQDVLLIWGEDDKILDKKFAQRFLEELPHARLEFIPLCGHVPHLENPQAVLNLLKPFLAAPK